MELPQLRCPFCAHIWVPRIKTPLKCPRCGKLLEQNTGTNEMTRNYVIIQTNGRHDGTVSLDIEPVSPMERIVYKSNAEKTILYLARANGKGFKKKQAGKTAYYTLPQKIILNLGLKTGIYQAVYDGAMDAIVVNLNKKLECKLTVAVKVANKEEMIT